MHYITILLFKNLCFTIYQIFENNTVVQTFKLTTDIKQDWVFVGTDL